MAVERALGHCVHELRAGAAHLDWRRGQSKTHQRLGHDGKIEECPEIVATGVVLTDVDLWWDDPEEAWISTSEFGLVSLGKEALFMHIPGKLELKRSRSGDAFTLYFHGDEENWYYHDFKLDGKKGRMNITTSDMTFYEELADLKASKKRKPPKTAKVSSFNTWLRVEEGITW